MKPFKQWIADNTEGLFVGWKPTTETVGLIEKYLKDNQEIPNQIDLEKLHVTILYSEKPCPGFAPMGKFSPPAKGTVKKTAIWRPSPDKPPVLVLELNFPSASERHKELMETLNATHGYPTFKTHLTLSYDVTGLKKSQIQDFSGVLEFNYEYSQQIDKDWK